MNMVAKSMEKEIRTIVIANPLAWTLACFSTSISPPILAINSL